MNTGSQRPLGKGPLRKPTSQPYNISYTEAPASKDEVSVRRKDEKKIQVVEVTMEDVSQPFLNPAIIQQRIQAEKQWKIAQERMKKQETASSSTHAPS